MTDEQMIAAWLKRHKVTRCPPALVGPSTATLPQAVMEFHRQRGEGQIGGAWVKVSKYKKGIQWRKSESRRDVMEGLPG